MQQNTQPLNYCMNVNKMNEYSECVLQNNTCPPGPKTSSSRSGRIVVFVYVLHKGSNNIQST